jgi:hypothetical protein
MTPAEYRATVTAVGRRLTPKHAGVLHIYEAITVPASKPGNLRREIRLQDGPHV